MKPSSIQNVNNGKIFEININTMDYVDFFGSILTKPSDLSGMCYTILHAKTVWS